MLDILIVILAVAGLAAVGFLMYVALQPAEFRIERTAEIAAPADKIFPLIDDLKMFNTWNPFAKADPTIRQSYSGPTSGVGATYAWSGQKMGAGEMRVTISRPFSEVTMDLEFTKPFAASNIAEFTLTPQSGSTLVSWAMIGRRPFSHKLMGALFNMDKMVGGEFGKGLASLKSIAEARS